MNWLVEFEKPSKEWSNGKSGDGIPDKEHDDAVRSWLSLLPSDIRMKNKSKNSGKNVRNTTTEPK